jgi:quercetin dioxygenase-like cupin family protein
MFWLHSQRTSGRRQPHEDSEQLLLLLEGILAAEIGSERLTMKDGDMVIIPAGVKHKFTTLFRGLRGEKVASFGAAEFRHQGNRKRFASTPENVVSSPIWQSH